MLSLLLFVLNNKNRFILNSDVYNINTRQNYDFYQPSSNLSLYQNGVYSVGIKVFNSPPTEYQKCDNPRQFKSAPKNYLDAHSFYSVDEQFNVSRE
jgi:hypothetical protein